MSKLFISLLLISSVAFGHTAEIFLLHGMPIDLNQNAKIYYVDDSHIFLMHLNSSLKKLALKEDKKSQQKKAVKIVSKNRGLFLKIGKTMEKVTNYGIKKVPVVVIDGKYQVLGTTNVLQAENLVTNYLAVGDPK